ncbi:hypothetical protein BB170200_05248 [Mycobacterium marinum]|nr:hypothetical protein BB170200_05248 [Mycobacterium marinum]
MLFLVGHFRSFENGAVRFRLQNTNMDLCVNNRPSIVFVLCVDGERGSAWAVVCHELGYNCV